MLRYNRVIWKDNATLRDLSQSLGDVFSGTQVFDYETATDYLYIGSDLPFNHRYVLPSVVNAVACTATVDIWDGTEWTAAVDVVDETAIAGASLAQGGIISWSPDRHEGWGREETTENISDLSTLKIYDLYWVRIKWSANLTGTTALAYVGHRFARDADLPGYYPDLNRTDVMTAFNQGTSKTNWNEQMVTASEEVINDLRAKGIIWSRNQVLDWQSLSVACIHKLAMIVYAAFGRSHEELYDRAAKRYKDALANGFTNVDKNKDARLMSYEKVRNFTIRRV